MRRKLVALGLGGTIALFSIGCGSTESADRAASAESSSQVFTAERFPVVLVDRQLEPTAFFVGQSAIGCSTGDYRAVLRSRSRRLPLRVRYEGCHIAGEEVRVETEGCVYMLEAGPLQAQIPVRFSCRAGRKIRFVIPGACSLELEPQTPGGGVEFGAEGRGSSRFPVVTFGLTGISVDRLGPAPCPIEEGDDIEVNFRIDLPGYELLSGEKGERVGVWIE